MPASQPLRRLQDAPATDFTTSGQGRIYTASAVPDFPNFRKAYNAPPDRYWQVELLPRLVELTRLESGWDSYGAFPLKPAAAFFAQRILHDFMRPRTPLPQLVPTSSGGVQLEWHEKDMDFELCVTDVFEVEMWFEDLRTGKQQALELTNDFSALREPFVLLTSR